MSYHILHYRLKKLKRAGLIWITLISLLTNLWIDNIRFTIFQTKSNEKSRVQIKRARWFTNQLIKLGSAFIKIGQLLSARPDLIPNTWIQELSKLQDQVPNFSFAQVQDTIRDELGSKFNEIDQIICDPVGSASLAQVHRATLKDGKKVVFKVQRPNLKELFIIDLGIMQQIAGLLQKNKNWSRGRNWVEIAKECRKVLMKELDFNCEAQYAARFRQQFLEDENVEVPEVIWDMSSEKVLCLSYLEGTKISDLEKLQSQAMDLPKIAEIGAISYLKQLVNYGFFHADPHPGNLLALEDGRLCYLDFGMMSEVSRDSRSGLIQAVVHLVNKNFDKLSQDFVKLGFLSEEVNLEPIVPAFQDVFINAVEQGVSKMDFKSVTDDMSGVMYKFPFRLPPYYALIIRSLLTLEGIALSVDPNFKILGAAYPYFARRLMEDPDPQLRESLKEMLFDNKKFKWDRLEDLLSNAAKQTNLDLEKLLDEVINLLFSSKGGFLRDEIIEELTNQIDIFSLRILKNLNNYLPNSIKLNTTDETNNLNDLIIQIEPLRNFLEIVQKVPGYSIDIFIKRVPRLINEPYTKEMGIKIAKKVTEKGVVRLVKIAAGANI